MLQLAMYPVGSSNSAKTAGVFSSNMLVLLYFVIGLMTPPSFQKSYVEAPVSFSIAFSMSIYFVLGTMLLIPDLT